MSGGEPRTVFSGPDGRFSFDSIPADAVLVVRAGGFAEQRQTVSTDVGDAATTVDSPKPSSFCHAPERPGYTNAAVSVVSAEQIRSSPAVVADDVLRSVPSFSLFPPRQQCGGAADHAGVMRGIGPGDQSRTLVLLDNVPFNDPFGGWVYWTRVPRSASTASRRKEPPRRASTATTRWAASSRHLASDEAARSNSKVRLVLWCQRWFGQRQHAEFDMFASHVYKKVGFAVEGSAASTPTGSRR